MLFQSLDASRERASPDETFQVRIGDQEGTGPFLTIDGVELCQVLALERALERASTGDDTEVRRVATENGGGDVSHAVAVVEVPEGGEEGLTKRA